MSILLKRGLSTARKNSEVILEDGLPFFEKDTKQLYIYIYILATVKQSLKIYKHLDHQIFTIVKDCMLYSKLQIQERKDI